MMKSPRSQTNDAPVLDRGRIDAITGGSAALARELVAALIGEAAGLAQQIRVAIAEADDGRTADLVHALKGIAGNVGAMRLQRAAGDLERAEVRDTSELRNCVAQLEVELAVLNALR
jgi:HPt (histidine-containing phosphotransfer) domain-containing protein